MTAHGTLGPWVRRFLLEYLVTERNLARNTQRSYRDTLALLLPFVARQARQAVEALLVEDLSAARIRQFLAALETERGCVPITRNQRLAAIRALAGFVGGRSPEHLAWAAEVRAVPFKKTARATITYLEKPELDALLAAPDLRTAQGRRDHALLLFLYNTGARADEAAQTLIADLELAQASGRDHSAVQLRGKGNKLRRCPLWPQMVRELVPLIASRPGSARVFLNRCGQPLTRFGIHTLVERHARRAAVTQLSLATKRVSPHVIRHTTATHLLRAGVDINTIRAWLGHVSLNTTNVYAEIDMDMKAKALAYCEIPGRAPRRRWRENPGLMELLRSL
jgi:site-specific recombinase XerD